MAREATGSAGASPSRLGAQENLASLDLPSLWDLALANNPALRETAAELEAARGRAIQAGKYPNPHFRFDEDTIGEVKGPAGTIRLLVNQEIVTAGKRRLDVAIAERGAEAASLAAQGWKFAVLTRVRRAYYDYLGWLDTVRTDEEVVAALEQALQITRRLVEEAKTRPKTDLLRIEALLEQARINLARDRVNAEAAWQQMGAEVGVPQLSMPSPVAIPAWWSENEDRPLDRQIVIERVLAAHTDLRQSAMAVERARLGVERARAEAVPNVTLGGGWTRNFPELEAGGVVTLETPIPLWDRKQGLVHEAEARWAQAQATEQMTALRLRRETAEAFARYQSARMQVDRLRAEVLPRLRQNLDLLRKGYQAGANQVAFSDVLLAEESLLTTRVTLAEARRHLWLAVADLQGLMQLDVGEEPR
jgi:cobalt-zinc-cadmium efflux system outer membrane protein